MNLVVQYDKTVRNKNVIGKEKGVKLLALIDFPIKNHTVTNQIKLLLLKNKVLLNISKTLQHCYK